MPDYTVIADIGETLVDLLGENMKDLIPQDSIALVSPGEIDGKDNVRLSLFLYSCRENAHLKNQEMIKINSTNFRYPPLALDLNYMLTSYPSTGIQDKTERTKEEHSVLGRAMQILNDNTILKGNALKGNLSGSVEELHLTITTMSLDDMTKIWTTFQEKPFRPSICYLVTPTMIDSGRTTEEKLVLEKKVEYEIPMKKE